MKLDLTVMHGCQNRFAIVDEDVAPIADALKSALVLEVAARLDVHGVLFVSARGGPRMRIFDRDGTEATMCGNGIRCAARYFRDHACVTGSHFTIGTLDGPKPVSLENCWVTVDMGRARDYRRLAEDRHFAFTGIPHLVILAGRISVDSARAEGRRLRYDRVLGTALGHPDGLHVNFAQVSPDGSLDVLTYEAGVEDVTPACGTGSTAAAYVCARNGQTSFPVRVRLLGGELVIDARHGSMTMRGPAEYMRPFRLEWSTEATPIAVVSSRGAGALMKAPSTKSSTRFSPCSLGLVGLRAGLAEPLLDTSLTAPGAFGAALRCGRHPMDWRRQER